MLLLTLFWVCLQLSLNQGVLLPTTTPSPQSLLGLNLVTAAPKPTEPPFFTSLPKNEESIKDMSERWVQFMDLVVVHQRDLLNSFINITGSWMSEIQKWERIPESHYRKNGKIFYASVVEVCGKPCQSKYRDFLFAAALHFKINVTLIEGVCCPNQKENYSKSNKNVTYIDITNNTDDNILLGIAKENQSTEFFQALEDCLAHSLRELDETKLCLRLFNEALEVNCARICPDKQRIYLEHHHCADGNWKVVNRHLQWSICCRDLFG